MEPQESVIRPVSAPSPQLAESVPQGGMRKGGSEVTGAPERPFPKDHSEVSHREKQTTLYVFLQCVKISVGPAKPLPYLGNHPGV